MCFFLHDKFIEADLDLIFSPSKVQLLSVKQLIIIFGHLKESWMSFMRDQNTMRI